MFRGENNIGQKFLTTLINQIGMKTGNINKHLYIVHIKGYTEQCIPYTINEMNINRVHGK